MKEDILEQVVDDYLQARGFFTRHNIKFKPRKDHPAFNSKNDSVPSDIDVMGINPPQARAIEGMGCQLQELAIGLQRPYQARRTETEQDRVRAGILAIFPRADGAEME